jgi:hypothetical protein
MVFPYKMRMDMLRDSSAEQDIDQAGEKIGRSGRLHDPNDLL